MQLTSKMAYVSLNWYVIKIELPESTIYVLHEQFCIVNSSTVAANEHLSCLPRTTKVLCSNLGAIRHIMTLDKSLTAVCLGSHGRCILITSGWSSVKS